MVRINSVDRALKYLKYVTKLGTYSVVKLFITAGNLGSFRLPSNVELYRVFTKE
jgi:hypothetical protein